MKQEYQRKPVPDWADMIAERDAKIESLRSEIERLKTELLEIKAMKVVLNGFPRAAITQETRE